MPPAHEIAHLAHVELRTPVPEESLEFFTGYLGLTQTGSAGNSVFLRAWDDYEQTTINTRGWTATPGRLHHIAFATGTRADILRAADLALDHGVFIETGPHKHDIQQTFFLYVYEPGGNRIELCNAGARLVLAPDWQPVGWTEAEHAKGQAWGLKTIESFHTHGTPPVAP